MNDDTGDGGVLSGDAESDDDVDGVGQWDLEELDSSRTRFVFRLTVGGEYCDLTGHAPRWRRPRVGPEHAPITVHHAMDPNPRLDHVFPMRDINDPVGRVHPDFADDDGFLSPLVAITDVNFAADRGVRQRLGVDPGTLERLRGDVSAELHRLANNSRRNGPWQQTAARVQPRRLGPNDVGAHEQMLIGQYGLFATDDTSRAAQGRILGIYLGALLRGEDDESLAHTQHPDYQRYLLDVAGAQGTGSKVSTYSADGAANSIAFANTALLAPRQGQRPAYDDNRINAVFVSYRVRLTDNRGRSVSEHVSVLVGLANLAAGHQVLVSYGDRFLEQFQPPSARSQRAAQRQHTGSSQPKRVKLEQPEPQLPQSGTPQLPGQDFRTHFERHGIQPLVNRRATLGDQHGISQTDATRLLDHIDQGLRANPEIDPQTVITETLRALWQGATARQDNAEIQIYNHLLRFATGGQGG